MTWISRIEPLQRGQFMLCPNMRDSKSIQGVLLEGGAGFLSFRAGVGCS